MNETRPVAAIMTAMRRNQRILLVAAGLACALLALPQGPQSAAQRSERPALAITGYLIDAELDPSTHHLSAKTVVR